MHTSSGRGSRFLLPASGVLATAPGAVAPLPLARAVAGKLDRGVRRRDRLPQDVALLGLQEGLVLRGIPGGPDPGQEEHGLLTDLA
eukprot:5227-Alexandrium_andersonii.AAC.1